MLSMKWHQIDVCVCVCVFVTFNLNFNLKFFLVFYISSVAGVVSVVCRKCIRDTARLNWSQPSAVVTFFN